MSHFLIGGDLNVRGSYIRVFRRGDIILLLRASGPVSIEAYNLSGMRLREEELSFPTIREANLSSPGVYEPYLIMDTSRRRFGAWQFSRFNWFDVHGKPTGTVYTTASFPGKSPLRGVSLFGVYLPNNLIGVEYPLFYFGFHEVDATTIEGHKITVYNATDNTTMTITPAGNRPEIAKFFDMDTTNYYALILSPRKTLLVVPRTGTAIRSFNYDNPIGLSSPNFNIRSLMVIGDTITVITDLDVVFKGTLSGASQGVAGSITWDNNPIRLLTSAAHIPGGGLVATESNLVSFYNALDVDTIADVGDRERISGFVFNKGGVLDRDNSFHFYDTGVPLDADYYAGRHHILLSDGTSNFIIALVWSYGIWASSKEQTYSSLIASQSEDATGADFTFDKNSHRGFSYDPIDSVYRLFFWVFRQGVRGYGLVTLHGLQPEHVRISDLSDNAFVSTELPGLNYSSSQILIVDGKRRLFHYHNGKILSFIAVGPDGDSDFLFQVFNSDAVDDLSDQVFSPASDTFIAIKNRTGYRPDEFTNMTFDPIDNLLYLFNASKRIVVTLRNNMV